MAGLAARAAPLVRALLLWFALVLGLGVAGFAVGLLIPCEGGLECLNYPFGGALLGAVLAAVAAAVLAARWMRWWWLPVTLLLLVTAVLVASLDETVALVLAVAAPVVAGLSAVRPAPATTAEEQTRRPWLPGVAALVCAAALAAGTWLVLERRERGAEIAELETVGVDLVAPTDRDDLRVDTVTTYSGRTVAYRLARGEPPEADYLAVDIRLGGGGCERTDLRPCVELGDGISAYRQADGDHWIVFRDLGTSHARLSDRTDSGRGSGWTEQQALEVARGLRPVDAAWLVDREGE
ncbi:hypothetical protein [Serinicoccus kebangsaanensis]|uniref:hypothetical protein n=1 Tax=Serinicoccus kebangsaanensis TaxID=2602069 RepID=UPI00124BE776|nr:hypothetical protein [Serinicoccus kebangsaanensis]